MPTNQPQIDIIIPNWNGKQFLPACLDSLKNQTCSDFCVTIVDNGSTDGSVEFVQQKYPEIHILQFEQNRGFSVAVNEGIRNSGSPWIMLLNNDVEVEMNCIEMLSQAITSYPDYDSFSLKMLSYHDRTIIDGAGDAALRGGVGYRIGTLEEDKGQYDKDRDVFGACAGAALYNRLFFIRAGLFDEDFFAYLEDLDINMRAVRAGLKCRYIGSAVVYHIGSATSGSKINPFTVRLSTKNNINVLVKNYPLSMLFRFFPVISIYQLMWFLFACKKKQVSAYIKGLFDAMSQLRTMMKKREHSVSSNTISNEKFALLLTRSELDAVQSIMSRRTALGKKNGLLELYLKFFLKRENGQKQAEDLPVIQ